METYIINSKNVKLAEKISKLVRGGVDPTQEPYVLDDVNILSILTLIYEYLVGEKIMFTSVYEGSKAIEDWIKEHEPDIAHESTLVAGIAILLNAINNVDLTKVAKQGSDPDVTLTGVDDKLDTLLGYFDGVTYESVMEELNIEPNIDDSDE